MMTEETITARERLDQLTDLLRSIATEEEPEGDVYSIRPFFAEMGAEEPIIRAELLLAGGGPTTILTWDERGPGWSDLFHSWAEPDTCKLTDETYEYAGRILERYGYELPH